MYRHLPPSLCIHCSFVAFYRINTYNALSVQVPFGGYKQSGFGRDAGMDSLNAYSEIKSVIVKVPAKNS